MEAKMQRIDNELNLEIKEIGNTSIDLSELNLNSRDIKKLDFDLVTRIKKITE